MNNIDRLNHHSWFEQCSAVFGWNTSYQYNNISPREISKMNLSNFWIVSGFFVGYNRWKETSATTQKLDGLKVFEVTSKIRAALEFTIVAIPFLIVADIVATIGRAFFNLCNQKQPPKPLQEQQYASNGAVNKGNKENEIKKEITSPQQPIEVAKEEPLISNYTLNNVTVTVNDNQAAYTDAFQF